MITKIELKHLQEPQMNVVRYCTDGPYYLEFYGFRCQLLPFKTETEAWDFIENAMEFCKFLGIYMREPGDTK